MLCVHFLAFLVQVKAYVLLKLPKEMKLKIIKFVIILWKSSFMIYHLLVQVNSHNKSETWVNKVIFHLIRG